MLKTIKKTYEATVCDYCDRAEDEDMPSFLEKCILCGNDVCPQCSASIHFYPKEPKPNEGNMKRVSICRSHLPEGLG